MRHTCTFVMTTMIALCGIVHHGQDAAQQQNPPDSPPDVDQDMTPLHYACEERDADAAKEIERLLSAGANPNARTVDGRTPLMGAARWNPQPQIIELLVEAGADVNASDERGLSVLHYATGFTQERRDPEAIAILIQRGAKVDAVSRNGWTPIMASAIAPGSDPLEFLIQIVASEALDENLIHDLVNQSLPDGWTPLMLAVASVTPEVWLRWDTEIGVEIGQDPQGDRMISGMQSQWARSGYVGRVWSLLAAGADPDATANDGTTVDTLLANRDDAESKAVLALINIARELD